MKKINIAEKSFNPFDLIGQKWMLISAGTEDKWNTMTASWGAVGVMWGKPSATWYIRKSRFTKEFVDAGEYFTLTVLKDGNRDVTDIAPDDMAQEVQDKWYGDHDYHTMYIGEIVAAYEN